MVKNRSGEISSGTGWTCQALKHFQVPSECGLPSNRDDDHLYYQRNLSGALNECDDNTNEVGWKYCVARNNFEASNTSIPGEPTIDDAFNAASRDGTSLVDVIRIVGDVVELRYAIAKEILSSAVNDIRNRWNITEGTNFHRAKVINKLIGYYLISMAIYVIELSFWTNGKLFRLFGNLLLEQKDHTRLFIGLCIVAAFVLVVYLLGGEGSAVVPLVCED